MAGADPQIYEQSDHHELSDQRPPVVPAIPGSTSWLATVALTLAVLAPFVVYLVLIVSRRSLAGIATNDLPLTEIAVRNAGRFHQLLGPYSRFQFHHPGPLPFYVLWPFVAVAGPGLVGLYAGALAVNAVASVSLVTILRRIAGVGVAAIGAASVLTVFAVEPRWMTYPWNPLYIALPLAVVVVACAGAMSTSPWFLPAATVAASFVVQAHVGPAPVVAVLAISTLVVCWRRFGRAATRSIVCAGSIAALLWLPVVVQQVATSDGNLSALADSIGSGPPRLPVGPAGSLFVRGATAFPLPAGEVHELADQPSLLRLASLGALLGLLALGAVIGWRGRRPVPAALCGSSLIVLCVAGVSTLAVKGEPAAYLTHWMSGLALVGWIAVGASVVAELAARSVRFRTGVSRTVVGALVVGAVVVGSIGVSVVSPSAYPSGAPWIFHDEPGAAAAESAVLGFVHRQDSPQVHVEWTDSRWEQAAALVNALDREGFDVTVDADWVFMYDPRFAPDRRPRIRLRVMPADRSGTLPDDDTMVVRTEVVAVVGSRHPEGP